MRIEKRSMKRWALLLLIAALAVSCIVLLTSCGECEHQWDEGTITEYATENAAGKKVFKCQLCGELKEEEIPKLAHQHSFTGDYEMSATEHTQTCSCGETKTEAHDFFEPVRTTEPKCGVAGEDTETCKICGYEKKTPVAALEHEFTKWNVTTPATCAADGEKTRSCTLCGETERETLPKLTVHSLTSTSNKDYYHAAVKVTCTTNGSPEYWTCTVCGKHFADGRGATELTAEQLVIPAPGHTIVHHAFKASTCDEAGNNEYWDCSVCHAKFADAQGNTAYTGDPTLPKKGHVMTKTERVEETCTTPGNIEYYTCGNCHKTFADEAGKNEVTDLVIPAGHKYTWVVSEEDANKCIGTCSRCGNVTEPRDHVFVLTKEDATCEGKLVLTNACDCGTKTVTYGPALGHTWGTGIAGEDGTVTYTCTVCGIIYTAPKSSVVTGAIKWNDASRDNGKPKDPNLTWGKLGNLDANGAIGKTESKSWADNDFFLEFTLRYDEFMSAFEIRLRSDANKIGSAGRGPFFNVSAEGLIAPASDKSGKILVPNDETTPESYQLEGYGWHRISFRIHQTHTVAEDKTVTYTNYVTLMVDGVEIGTYKENGTTFTSKQWNRYKVTVAEDGTETIANTNFNPYFQIYRGGFFNNPKKAHFINVTDDSVYAGAEFAKKVSPIEYVGAVFPKMGQYVKNGFVVPSYAVSEVPYFYYEGTALDLPTPMVNGATFNGWTTDAAGEVPFTGITAETTGKVTVYPAWLCDHTDVKYVVDVTDPNKCIGTCQICGKVFEAREHVWEAEETVPNTCDTVGYVKYVCVCGAEKIVRNNPALGHFFGTGTVADDGTTVYVCTACGTIYNQPATSVITEIKSQDVSKVGYKPNDNNLTIGWSGLSANDAIKKTESGKWADYDFFLEFTLRYDEYMSAFEIRLRSDANNIGPAGRGAFFHVSADGLLSPADWVLVPNEETTPASYQLEGYGWHRIAFRIHQTHTVAEDKTVTYTNYVTLMVDGVEIGTYRENETCFTKCQWNRYSVTVADGVETVDNTNFNPYFQIYRGGFFNQLNKAWFIQIADPTTYAATAPTAVSPIEYVDAVFPKMGKFTGNGFVTPSYAVSEVPYFYYEGKALALPTPTVGGKVASLFSDAELTTPVAITAETTGKVVAYAGEYKFVTVTGLGITYETAGVTVDATAATKTFDTQGEDLVITLPKIGTLPDGVTANGWYLDGVKIAEADATTATVPASRAAVATAMRVTLSVSKAGKVASSENPGGWGFTLNDATATVDENGNLVLVKPNTDKDMSINIGSAVKANLGAITYTTRMATTEDALKNKTVLPFMFRARKDGKNQHVFLSVSTAGVVTCGDKQIATLSTEMQEFTFVLRAGTAADGKLVFLIDAYVNGRLMVSGVEVARTLELTSYVHLNSWMGKGTQGTLILGDVEAYDGIHLD